MKAKRSSIAIFEIVVLISVIFTTTVNEGYACYNPPPYAILKAIPEYVIVNRLVTLDGSDSYPSIVEYKWDFTNNGSYDYAESSSSYPDGALDGITTHRYTSTDNYTAKLWVKRSNDTYDTDTCTVHVCADSDNDDLPDGWETINFLDPNNTNDADTDLDNDGYNNLSEYLHGTDPNDSNEVPGSAITIRVPDNVGTIQRAINAAIENDTIVVKPGRYYENLCFTDKEITLSCIEPNNPYVVAATIIDGNDANSVIIFGSGDANSTVAGFTITNGRARASQGAYSDYGGGIYCNGVSPEIINCVITRNEAYKRGGGMYNNNSTATITNCIFSKNTTTSGSGYGGAGIYNGSSDVIVTNCIFTENMASIWDAGGGIYNYSSDPIITNCAFSKNISEVWDGGGIYNSSPSSEPNITNCIFWDNDAGRGTTEEKQIYGGNPTVNYCCIEGLDSISGQGNIGNDPCFVNPWDPNGPDDIFATFDDGLCLEANSPCIDAADGDAAPSADIIAQIRVDINDVNNTGTGDPNYVDMGAYEFPIIWYVDANAGTGGDGTSWDDAFDDLQDALSEANDGEQIWVAGGTYKPTDSNNRAISFELVEGVCIYGGFAGTETYRYQRDWTEYPTILTGDINEPNDANDNSYHVVVGVDEATMDGFIITGGNADSTGEDGYGGGVYCLQVSPTISNCAIADNEAVVGSGLYNNMGSPVVTNCVFSGNKASNTGGGMYTRASLPIVRNCTFNGNQALIGGGMTLHLSAAALTVTNCIFWGNSAVLFGNDILLIVWQPTFSYCDIKGCGGSGGGWNSQFGIDGGGNIDADPCFTDINSPVGQDGVFATSDDGLQLQTISPCIDKGDDTASDVAGMTMDIIRNARKIDGDKDYEAVVDMGAYEYDTFIVKNITKGIKYNTIQAAVDAAADDDVIVVSEGTYYENVNVDNKRITLTGIDPYDPCVVEGTIIDGNNTSNVVTFKYSGASGSVITGFTIQNGYSRGISCSSVVEGSLTITNCIIIANGGGINSCWGLDLTVTDCNITNNGSDGGIDLSSGEHTITDCIISNNQGTGIAFSVGSSTVSGCVINSNTGSGIYCNGSNIILRNCVIAKNSNNGINVTSDTEQASIINCTIVGNASTGVDLSSNSREVASCILWDNSDDLSGCFASYSCIEDEDTGWGNFSINPMFVDADNNDFHLLGWSRCIDYGDPSSEYFNEPGGGGGRINVGAYGNTQEAALQTDEGDGLPDEWQKHYWPDYDPNNPDPNYGLGGDPDTDDFNNLVEYLFGYDPNSSTTASMDILVGLDTSQVLLIDPTKGETVILDYVLNMGTDVDVDIGFTRTDTTQPARTISQLAGAGVSKQVTWNGADDAGKLVTNYFYDVNVAADDGDGNSCTWTSPQGQNILGGSPTCIVDVNNFDPYKNLPAKITITADKAWVSNVAAVKDGFTSENDGPWLGGIKNDEDYVDMVAEAKLVPPGEQTFYWYGRSDPEISDPNAGKIFEEAFDITYWLGQSYQEGVIQVYYDEPLKNLRCNPYRITPTFDEVTTISYDLAYDASVTIEITNPNGNYFGTLLDNVAQTAGHQEVVWYGRDSGPNDPNAGDLDDGIVWYGEDGDPCTPDSKYMLDEGEYLIEVKTNDPVYTVKGVIAVHR